MSGDQEKVAGTPSIREILSGRIEFVVICFLDETLVNRLADKDYVPNIKKAVKEIVSIIDPHLKGEAPADPPTCTCPEGTSTLLYELQSRSRCKVHGGGERKGS